MTPERFRRIEEIYHAACERVPEERSEFLDGACQGDTEARQRIEQMLAQEIPAAACSTALSVICSRRQPRRSGLENK
jgi:hypothetical protein